MRSLPTLLPGLAGVLIAVPHLAFAQVVISEFRTRGPNGAADEFIELYNKTTGSVNIGGWKVKGSNNAGTVGTRATIPAGTILHAGCYYLLTNSSSSGGPYSGSAAGDQTYTTGIADDGGIGLTRADDSIVDQVGMSAGSAFKEGSVLTPLTTSVNRGYERKPGGASGNGIDTDNNASDFQLITPSAPQNHSSTCIVPTNPGGTGSAFPDLVPPGGSTLLTIAVTPGINPTSTGLAVSANLTPLSGSATQSCYDDGTNGDVTAGDLTFSYLASVGLLTPEGEKELQATIVDAQGRNGPAVITLTVCAAPVVTASPSNATKCSGEAVTFEVTASGSDLSYQWRKDGTPITDATGSSHTIGAVSPADAGTYDVAVSRPCGSSILSGAATLIVNACDSRGPIMSQLLVSPNPVAVNTAVLLTAFLSDDTTGGSIIQSAAYSVNGAPAFAMVPVDYAFDEIDEDISATIGGAAFPLPGLYSLCAWGTDIAGNTGPADCTILAVYDPSAGFVTGGGWIMSPPGAYAHGPGLTGKAMFGFVSRYHHGASQPSGATDFHFRMADLHFRSTSYDWLVISGARATYRGYGRINGSGDYSFMLSAIDGQVNGGGGVDKFRIKIMNRSNGGVVYDNQMGAGENADPSTAIGGGSIVIHRNGLGKEASETASRLDGSLPAGFALHQNHPNPFNPLTQIPFDLSEDARVRVTVSDLLGREVLTILDEVLGAGRYRTLWEGRDRQGRQMATGVYHIRLSALPVSGKTGFVATRRITLLK